MKKNALWLFALLLTTLTIFSCGGESQTTIVCPAGIDCRNMDAEQDAAMLMRPNDETGDRLVAYFQKYGTVNGADATAAKINELVEANGKLVATLTASENSPLSDIHAQLLGNNNDKVQYKFMQTKSTYNFVGGCVNQVVKKRHTFQFWMTLNQKRTDLFTTNDMTYTNPAGQECFAIFGSNNLNNGGFCSCFAKGYKPAKQAVTAAAKKEIDLSNYQPTDMTPAMWVSIVAFTGAVIFAAAVM